VNKDLAQRVAGFCEASPGCPGATREIQAGRQFNSQYNAANTKLMKQLSSIFCSHKATIGYCMALGVAFGAAAGALTGNLAIGMALGVAAGALTAVTSRK
jgi:hypothetical protein